MWRDGGPASAWRTAGVRCRPVAIAEGAGWDVFRSFCAPVMLPARSGHETAPRLQALSSCTRAAACLSPTTGIAVGRDGPTGDLLVGHALLVACLSRPRTMLRAIDPDAEREVERFARLRKMAPHLFDEHGEPVRR
jgi:hypothetical protein